MDKNGQIIGEAYNLVKKTFDAINRLKNDLSNQILEFDPTLKSFSEYSYGPKNLSIKANHTFIFTRDKEDGDKKRIFDDTVFGMVCLFDNDAWGLNKISLKGEPELWTILMGVKNRRDKISPWDVSELLKRENRGEFTESNLQTTGIIYNFHWKDNESKENPEEWTGRVIGYPLVAISSSDVIRENILMKLFNDKEVRSV